MATTQTSLGSPLDVGDKIIYYSTDTKTLNEDVIDELDMAHIESYLDKFSVETYSAKEFEQIIGMSTKEAILNVKSKWIFVQKVARDVINNRLTTYEVIPKN